MIKNDPGKALNSGTFFASILYAGISALFVLILDLTTPAEIETVFLWKNWGAGLFGVLAGLAIGVSTDYFTDDGKNQFNRLLKHRKKVML